MLNHLGVIHDVAFNILLCCDCISRGAEISNVK